MYTLQGMLEAGLSVLVTLGAIGVCYLAFAAVSRAYSDTHDN